MELKLAKLPDRTPVKMTFSASPELAKGLGLYATCYAETYDEEPLSELIPFMLQSFLDSDKGFAKFRKEKETAAAPEIVPAMRSSRRRRNSDDGNIPPSQ